jgi:hypothetical protein
VSGSPTPILDRLEPLPPLKGARIMHIGTGPLVTGVATGIVLAFVDVRSYLGFLRGYVAMAMRAVEDVGLIRFSILLAVAMFVTVAIHEAGHAVGGALAGFHVHSIRVWRFQLEFKPLKLSIFRGPMGGAGGWAVCTPATTDRLAAAAMLMLFAGPAANLLSGFLIYLLPGDRGLFATVLMIWSFVIGGVNLLPLRTGPLFSDGHRLLMLLFDRRRGERWLALLELSKELLDGVSPESFSDEFIGVATAVTDDSSDTVSAYVIAYTAAFRRRRYDEAALALETCLRYSSRTSKPYRHALMADAAVFQGRARRNDAAARAWLNDMPAKTAIPWHRAWGEAGVLHAQGDWDALAAKLDAIEVAIRSHPGPQQAFLLNAVAYWRADLPHVISAPPNPGPPELPTSRV